MRRSLLFCLFVLTTPAQAFFSLRSVGATGADFLKIEPDARGAAMAGAGSASEHPPTAIFWNPAGLASAQGHSINATHGVYFQDLFYDAIAYVHPFGPKNRDTGLLPKKSDVGVLSLGILYLNSGDFRSVDKNGNETGETFTPQDLGLSLAWATPLGAWDVGFSFEFLRLKLFDTTTAFGGSLGLRRQFFVKSRHPYTVGLVVRHLGAGPRFQTEDSPLPTEFRLGQTLWINEQWIVSLDAAAPKDGDPYWALGSEYLYPISPKLLAAGRIGYQTRFQNSELESLAGLALGGGIRYEGTSIDYSWSPVGLLGDIHRLGLTWRF